MFSIGLWVSKLRISLVLVNLLMLRPIGRRRGDMIYAKYDYHGKGSIKAGEVPLISSI